ncbi:Tudor domain-containing protein [Trichinella pseudospiralis]
MAALYGELLHFLHQHGEKFKIHQLPELYKQNTHEGSGHPNKNSVDSKLSLTSAKEYKQSSIKNPSQCTLHSRLC